MSEKPYWSVTVSINGEPALTIEPRTLSGIENIADYRDQIIEAADHLIAFIGREEGDPFDPDAETPHERAIKEAYRAGVDAEAERQWLNRDTNR